MKKLLLIIQLVACYTFVGAQINQKKTPRTEYPKGELEHVNLDGWPFLSVMYGRRELNFPSGTFRLAFDDGYGDEIIFEDEILSPTSLAHCFEIQVMGAYHNDVWTTSMMKKKFWVNTYLFWSMRVGYYHGTRINASQGGSHHIEIGGDFGIRKGLDKNHFLEFGLKAVPMHMNYLDIKRFDLSEFLDKGGHLDFGYNQFSLGAHPFLKWGLYFQTKQRLNSIDFKGGYHLHWIYGSMKHLFLSNYNEDIDGTVQPEKVFLNNKELRPKDFSLNGWFLNVAWTFYFN
jgi:hypothetical protein